MEITDVWLYGLLCAGAAFAGFIDAVVGGGGLVQVPLLFILFPQLTHVQVIATNRFASVAGTLVASAQYIRTLGVDATLIWATGIAAAVSSFGGTFAMALMPPEVFKPLLLVVIIVLAVYSFFKKDLGAHHAPRFRGRALVFAAIATGSVLGFYNGFVGPGTGTLLVFAFVSVLGLGFLQSSANAKIINVVADLASLIGFFISKSIVYKLALPMMVCNMAGSYAGSKAAMWRGNVFVRYVFLAVLLLLIGRLAWDIASA
ncbi:MAG: TSUP family transporter [Cyclobacteriaceae bacterium]|jgi:hypothetical protein|nr:TSUP family transporter [Cyclobacteriaceae bacterium]